MFEALETIINTFSSLLRFALQTFQSFLNLAMKIPQYTLFITNSVALLPAVLIPFILSAVSIYVILFLLGRN